MKSLNRCGDKLAGKSNRGKLEQAILWQGGQCLSFDAECSWWKVSAFKLQLPTSSATQNECARWGVFCGGRGGTGNLCYRWLSSTAYLLNTGVNYRITGKWGQANWCMCAKVEAQGKGHPKMHRFVMWHAWLKPRRSPTMRNNSASSNHRQWIHLCWNIQNITTHPGSRPGLLIGGPCVPFMSGKPLCWWICYRLFYYFLTDYKKPLNNSHFRRG